MRHLLVISLTLNVGCRAGILESGEWGQLRYFGELQGELMMPGDDQDEDSDEDDQEIDVTLSEALVVVPPVSDRNGNVYVLHQRPTSSQESAVYVGSPFGGWSPGCLPGDGPEDTGGVALHGFLGTSQDMAWYWSGESLVQVSGNTGECTRILKNDPLSLSSLSFVAGVPYVHETPARRTLNAWVLTKEDALLRLPPSQVIVDLDLRRYVSYSQFEPADATCVTVLGVGANPDKEEGVVVVAYNDGSYRVQEARFIDPNGKTTNVATLDMNVETFFKCGNEEPENGIDFTEERPEPMILGQLQSNDQGIYAGLLSDGELLSFNTNGGGSKPLPDMAAEGMVKVNGELWISGVVNNEPVVGQMKGVGSVNTVARWESSKRAANNLNGKVQVLDERISPPEPLTWESPLTAMGSFPFMSPFPLDTYAENTTGWLIAGPSFGSDSQARTAVAYGAVGMTVP